MMTPTRFARITGHEVTEQPIGGMVSVQALCDCSGENELFYTTETTLKEALIKLHDYVYKHHARIVFERQKWRCAHCGQRLPLDAHHKVRRSKGRDDRVDNLVGLDRRCHQIEGNRVRPADGGKA